MKRLSFRPRPLDINKKLSLVTSRQELDGDEFGRGASCSGGGAGGAGVKDGEQIEPVVASPAAKKVAGGSEIPTPEFVVVDSYERDYTRTFVQPQSYIRARSARSETAQYCEYDLDDDDEHWLQKLNEERSILAAERFETMLYKLEIVDHHGRLQRDKDRLGPVASIHGTLIPVVLSKEDAVEALDGYSNSLAVLGAVYDYWKGKRESLRKPILRRLQPAPPVNDPSPFNVFRPREKIHRPHTRRMQRRENDVASFGKLRQVRRHFGEVKEIMRLIQEREKKKRELMQVESNMQRIELALKAGQNVQHDAVRMEVEDGSPVPSRISGVEDGHRVFFRTDNLSGNGQPIPSSEMTPPAYNATAVGEEREVRIPRRKQRFPPARSRWKGGVKALEHLEPTFLFTKPLDLGKLEKAGISITDGDMRPFSFRHSGRFGRGGRLVIDRWNHLDQAPVGLHNHNHFLSKPFAIPVSRGRPTLSSRPV